MVHFDEEVLIPHVVAGPHPFRGLPGIYEEQGGGDALDEFPCADEDGQDIRITLEFVHQDLVVSAGGGAFDLDGELPERIVLA